MGEIDRERDIEVFAGNTDRRTMLLVLVLLNAGKNTKLGGFVCCQGPLSGDDDKGRYSTVGAAVCAVES